MPAVDIPRDKQRALEVPNMNACRPIIVSMVLETIVLYENHIVASGFQKNHW